MKTRYYFWQKTIRGWNQWGRGDGYTTLKECEKDNDFYMKEIYPYMILKATPIKERNEIK